MATINWTDVWRRVYLDGAANLGGAGYFAKEDLWILCGLSSIILTTDHDSLLTGAPVWTPRTDGGGSDFTGVASDASRAIICGDNNWLNESTDGITWSGVQTSPAPGHNLLGIAAGPNTAGTTYDTFVTVAAVANGPIYERGVGGTWSNLDIGGINDRFRAVCTDGAGTWLAVGEQSSVGFAALTSDPSGAWTRYTIVGPPSFYSCAHGNGQFMIGGTAGILFTSPNGQIGTWTFRSTGGTDTVNAINHLGGTNWLATGNTGNIYLSADDGVSWSPVSAVGSDIVRAAGSSIAKKTTLLAAQTAAWSSFEETQDDYQSTVVAPSSPPALTENTQYVLEAIRRLAQQFRS